MIPASALDSFVNGPIPSALSEWLGNSEINGPAFDFAVVGLTAIAMIFAAIRLGLSKPFAALAGILLLAHSSAGSAIPHDGRGILLTSLFGLSAIAAAGAKQGAGRAASAAGIVLLTFASLCGSPVAPAYGMHLGARAGERRNRVAAFLYYSITGLCLGAWISTAAIFAFVPAAAAFGQAMAPFWPAPDLYSSSAAPQFILFGLAFPPLVGLDWKFGPRATMFYCISLIGALFTTPGFFLHERASLAFAPCAAMLWAGSLELASKKLPLKLSLTAGAALAAAFGTFGIIKYNRAADADVYIEHAVAAAPDSPLLLETYGHVLAARARGAGLASEQRIVLLHRSIEQFLAAWRVAKSGRKFTILEAAVESSILAGDGKLTTDLLPRLASEAVNEDQHARAALFRCKFQESQGEAKAAVDCARAAVEQYEQSLELKRYYLRIATSGLTQQIVRARAEKNAAAESTAMAALDALEVFVEKYTTDKSGAFLRAAALVSRGRIRLARGKAVDAARDFNDAKRADPRLADAYIGAAEAYLSQQILDGAVRELRDGLAATQPTPPAELLVSLAAVELQNGGPPENSLQLVELARQADPGALQLKKTMAVVRVALADKRMEKGDLAGAEQALAMAKDEAPESARVHAAFARLRDKQKRIDEAAQCYDKAFALDPGSELREAYAVVLKNQALAHLYAHDRAGAIAVFMKLRSLNSTNTDLGAGADILGEEAKIKYEEGLAAAQSRKIAEAKKLYGESLIYLPENYYALSQLGALAADDNDVETSIALFERAIASAKAAQMPLSNSAVYYNLAQQYRLNGKYDKAIEAIRDYQAIGPGPYSNKCEALLEIIEALKKN
ncbi:MAG: hypothetical protein HY286_13260 [Planctomycetes bacterium]|nr:hypothetical protein [Planctomycetota bacterium]